MENRRKPPNAVPDASPAKAKSDDFEPKVSSSGPQPVDGPTPPPPSSYGWDTTPPAGKRK